MVSFSCEACNETMLKKKVAAHIARCHAPVTCIDCSKTFPGQTFKEHNQCMTEDQKYQGKLYKPKQLTPKQPATPSSKAETPAAKKTEAKPESKANPVKITKKQSLKKLLKKLRSEHNFDKKEILNKLTVDTDGRLLLTM